MLKHSSKYLTREIKGASITEQGPVGLLGTKAFLCPPFLTLRKMGLIQLPELSLSSMGQAQTVVDR